MPNLGPFPSKEADLNLYFQMAVPYLIANSTRLLVSTENQSDLTNKLLIWNGIFPASQNRNTRTKTIVQNKNTAKDSLIGSLRTVYADVPASIWTAEDRTTLNVVLRRTTRTPAPVPVSKPIAQVNTNRRLAHTISFIDEDGASAKPAKVRGCQIWYKIGASAIDPRELTFLVTDTSSPHIHRFDGEDAGKPVYYWLRWENTRGETGPWSDTVMANVMG